MLNGLGRVYKARDRAAADRDAVEARYRGEEASKGTQEGTLSRWHSS